MVLNDDDRLGKSHKKASDKRMMLIESGQNGKVGQRLRQFGLSDGVEGARRSFDVDLVYSACIVKTGRRGRCSGFQAIGSPRPLSR